MSNYSHQMRVIFRGLEYTCPVFWEFLNSDYEEAEFVGAMPPQAFSLLEQRNIIPPVLARSVLQWGSEHLSPELQAKLEGVLLDHPLTAIALFAGGCRARLSRQAEIEESIIHWAVSVSQNLTWLSWLLANTKVPLLLQDEVERCLTR